MSGIYSRRFHAEGTPPRPIVATDHKRIAILYLIGSIAAFVIAGVVALLMRAELSAVGPTLTANPTTYNVWLYVHGTLLILGVQIPALTGFLPNYCVPLMIGAKEVAFPRLNAFSVWLFYMGLILALLTFVMPDPPDVLWTGYPPYSTITTGSTAFFTLTVLLIGFASILAGINLLTTIIYMRAPGVTWNKLNVFVWATAGSFVMQLIYVPVLGASVLLLSFDKYIGTGFFDPTNGGDVLTYQNLFWFYSHPAVYVIFVPFFAIIMEIFATFAKNPIFNYKVAVYGGIWCLVAISGEVWIHHMYASGMPDWLRLVQMVTTLFVSVPVGLLTISLLGTLYRGSITFEVPMQYALCTFFLFLVGGLTGIPLAVASLDVNLTDTYYVVGHFHYVMALTGTLAIFAGIYYWFPKMTGRMFNATWARIGLLLNFVGANVVFARMMSVGIREGLPRRYYDWAQFPQVAGDQLLMTAGSAILALGFAITLVNWIVGAVAGRQAAENPWGSKSLEWTTVSPPPPGNWPTPQELAADWSPYAYGKR
ncbi:MAG: cbb3-type cytochrome c oxidase subunit I [Rhodocyclales bacterium]|nr:cbb3-type cytochrome c oxidase subunit I [Rhodocyclales bacterium]